MGKNKSRLYPNKPQNNKLLVCPRYEEYIDGTCGCEIGKYNAIYCKGNPHNCCKVKYRYLASINSNTE